MSDRKVKCTLTVEANSNDSVILALENLIGLMKLGDLELPKGSLEKNMTHTEYEFTESDG